MNKIHWNLAEAPLTQAIPLPYPQQASSAVSIYKAIIVRIFNSNAPNMVIYLG